MTTSTRYAHTSHLDVGGPYDNLNKIAVLNTRIPEHLNKRRCNQPPISTTFPRCSHHTSPLTPPLPFPCDACPQVSVYQLGGRLFFNAYCPLTSTYRHASLLLSEVSMLLSPSSFQTQHDVHWNEPPSAYHRHHLRTTLVKFEG